MGSKYNHHSLILKGGKESYMATKHSLHVEEITQALKELGGEADWHNILKLVTNKRGGSYEGYKNKKNYENTAFQLIMQHSKRSPEYAKFKGRVLFQTDRTGRFSLVAAQSNATITTDLKTTHDNEMSKNVPEGPTPIAADIAEPPKRISTETYRILRDTKLVIEIKKSHGFQCQVCHNPPLKLNDAKLYAEGHHIKPLGSPHDGTDVRENILCVCPNCHVLLDYGAIDLNLDQLSNSSAHTIGREYIDYHNHKIYRKVKIE
jgi:hypothetical protein